jgi:cell division protein FtsB
MKLRLVLLPTALVIAVVSGLFHVRAVRTMRAQQAEHELTQQQIAALHRESTELARQAEALRQRLAALRQEPPPAAAAPTKAASAAKRSLETKSDAVVIADTPELRTLRVRSFVSEQHTKFAGLFQRLGLSVEQLHRFDAIQAEYAQGFLDVQSSASEQGLNGSDTNELLQHARDTRDAQLREVFGASFEAWQEANRTIGPRTQVRRMLEQMYPSAGPVENSRSEQLIAIVASHAQPHGIGVIYNWDAIGAEAESVLSGTQLTAFKDAAAWQRLSTEMAAVAARKR